MSLTTLENPQAKGAARPVGIRADAPAKVNLTLDVHGLRGDGYHELRSLVIGVDLTDQVHCRTLPKPNVTLDCNNPVLTGDDNLVVRAARSLADHCRREPAVGIDLQKRISV